MMTQATLQLVCFLVALVLLIVHAAQTEGAPWRSLVVWSLLFVIIGLLLAWVV
jgi:hypothetical protein